jgi:hypothetical protein
MKIRIIIIAFLAVLALPWYIIGLEKFSSKASYEIHDAGNGLTLLLNQETGNVWRMVRLLDENGELLQWNLEPVEKDPHPQEGY